MKQRFLLFLALAILASMRVMASVSIDGINYDLDANTHTATVAKGTYGAMVNIPSEVEYEGETYTVTAIGNSAFYGNKDLLIAILPSTIETIGDYAFYNCSCLRQINLPESLKVIGRYAFEGCADLAAVELPEALTALCTGCFRSCTSLTSMSIGRNVSFIGSSVFALCSSMTSLSVSEDNEYFKLEGGCIVTKKEISSKYSTDGTMPANLLISAPNGLDELIIPDGVVYLFGGSCANTKIKKVVVPEGVTTISWPGYYGSVQAFAGASSLRFLILPTTMAKQNVGSSVVVVSMQESDIVGDYVFNKETGNLTNYIGFDSNITLPATNNKGTAYEIGEKAFYKYGIQYVTFSDGVKAVGKSAFEYCENLQGLTLSSKTTSIGEGAFRYCKKLARVYDATGLKSTGVESFRGCYELVSFDLGGSNVLTTLSKSSFMDCNKLAEFTFPSSLTAIGEASFNCTGLTSADLSSCTKLYNIQDRVFSGCNKMESVQLPNTILIIGANAFSGCTKLAEINIPSNLMKLGASAFYRTAIKAITIPAGVTDLPEYTFSDCEKLETVELPSALNSIGNMCFYNCGALTNFDLPSGLTELGDNAFFRCSSLKSITIPSRITELKDRVFYGCGLQSIEIPDHITSIGAGAFYACPIQSVTIPDHITTIKGSTFQACDQLVSVTLPANLETIEGGAFSSCRKLTHLTLPNTLSAIGDNAFINCFALAEIDNNSNLVLASGSSDNGMVAYYAFRVLNKGSLETVGDFVFDKSTLTIVDYVGSDTEVVLPESYKGAPYNVGDGAFLDRDFITSVTLNDNITSLGRGAFKNCTSLVDVPLCNSIVSIGANCFDNCTSLTKITLPEGVTVVPDRAFYNCIALEECTLSKNTTSIGLDVWRCANDNVHNVYFLVIPQTVTHFARVSSNSLPEIYGPHVIINNRNQMLTAHKQNIVYQSQATMTIYNGKNSKYSGPVNLLTNDFFDFVKDKMDSDNVISTIYGVPNVEMPFNCAYLRPQKINNNWSLTWGSDKITLTDGVPFYNESKIYADEVRYERDFTTTAWQALCVPYELKYDDWKDVGEVVVFTSADERDGVVLNCTTVKEGSIPANTPCLIKPHTAGPASFVSHNVVLSPTPDEEKMPSVVLDSKNYIFRIMGNYQEKTDMFVNQYYGLSNGLFCKAANSSVFLSPWRLYMSVIDQQTGLAVTINPSSSSNIAARIVIDGQDDEATFINHAEAVNNDPDAFYDMSGRRVSKPTKGLYIRNGKKVIVK